MKNLTVVFLSVWALTILPGCGGSGGTCGNTTACGGDIVGTWKITSSCISVDATSMVASMGCPGETASASGFTITGSITYNADMTYSSNSTLSGNVVVGLPASCLTQQGITITCGQLQQVLQGMAATAGFQSVRCSGSSGCSCTVALAPQASTETGTYGTTAAGVLTTTAAGGTPSGGDYCVKGTTLTESPQAGASMMGQGSISGTITLTKQ
jgi:hypothetical protein